MKKSQAIVRREAIENKILLIRGQKVMLDAHLAELYGVETKALKRAVKRNLNRFPADFMFELTKGEYDALRYQFGAFKERRAREVSAVCIHRAGRRHAFIRAAASAPFR